METEILAVNDFFEVVLKGKATSGYLWQYEISDEEMISVVEQQQPVPANNTMMPGSSVDEVFRVTALKKGEAKLRFFLSRSWESDSINPKAEKIIQVSVA